MRGAILGVVTMLLASSSVCATAAARDAVVTSFDATPILTHFYPARTLDPGEQAPTVLVGPGWATAGYVIPDQNGGENGGDRIGVGNLLNAGFNVLTWDPRGFGASGGVAQFDSVNYEARDVQRLVDYVAQQPEAQLDAAGDPRVGMSGSSYGGGVQWVAGAIEPRLDALIPDVAWNSLVSSFDRDGSFKVGWMLAICINGQVLGTLDGILGLLGGTGLQTGSVAPEFTTMCVNGNLLGTLPPASVGWLASRGPGTLVDAVHAPTLITQGTVDTLFPPGEAIANYLALRANAVPVKMLWYCGGHGTCTTPAGDPTLLRETGLRWLRRWLMSDTSVDTGPAFEWIDDGGVLRSAADYPLPSAGTLPGAGAGSLVVLPTASVTDGPILLALPAIGAVEAQYAPPTVDANVVGEPTITLTYRGLALPAATHLYAQVVDVAANRVVGNQVTPIPVILDGVLRTVTRKLEVIAIRGRPTSNLRVQVITNTPLYAGQHSAGLVWSLAISSSLPLAPP